MNTRNVDKTTVALLLLAALLVVGFLTYANVASAYTEPGSGGGLPTGCWFDRYGVVHCV